jgi:putative ABC transport system permease protein
MAWRRFFERRRRDDDFAGELAAYVAHETDDNIARGMDPRQAREAALRKLGNRTALQEEIHRMNSLGFIESVWQDMRYGARMLRTNAGFTAVAVVSLALGIGANAALFQLIDAVLLRSLPVKAPEQLVRIGLPPHSNRSGNFWDQPNDITEPQWEFIRANHKPFEDVFAWGRSQFNLSESGTVRFAHGIYVSGDFFGTLGVPALIGRTIGPGDDHPGCGTSAAVVSYGFWQRELGGEGSALGRTISLNARRFPVIGVTPPEFTGIDVGEPFDVAVPVCSEQAIEDQSNEDRRAFWWLGVFGRLKPSVPLTEANAFVRSISPDLYRSTVSPHYRPDTAKEYLKLRLEAIHGGTGFSNLRLSVETPLLLLFSLAGLVLIIACANLANLLLARATVREHEIAVRLAVGASRWRVIQQLLSESLLIAGIGSLSGAMLALALSRYLITSFSTTQRVYSLGLRFDIHFLGFLAGITLLTCILFGLAPTIRATRRQPGTSLKQAGRSTTSGRERFGLQRMLVVAQITLSLILLVGSLLFVRSFQTLMTLDPGFRSNGVLTAAIDFPPAAVPEDRRLALDTEILKELRAIAGVDSAAAVTQPPVTGGYSNNSIHIDGDKVEQRLSDFNWTSEGYFQTMGIPLLAGRDFTPHDDNASVPVVIVDNTFASKFLGGANPIGRTLYVPPEPGQPIKRFTIVGLVGRSKYQDMQSDFQPIVYQPIRQRDKQFSGIWFVIHSSLPLASTIKQVNHAIGSVNSRLTVDLQSLPTLIDDSVRREDVMAKLSGFFGILALILATVGLYGVMSYIVTHRRSEIGIRLAIGATPKSILAMVLKQSMVLLAAGLAAGAILSFLCSRWAQSLLFQVQANDPAIIVAAALVLGAVTIAATLIPARRAANLDPMTTLRDE